MKVRDARTIINLKKKKQQQQQQKKVSVNVNNSRIVDARQILKSKRKKNKPKFKAAATAEIPTALVKKELSQILKSVADSKEVKKNKEKRMQSDKRVEFARGGILTITSKGLASSKVQQVRTPLNLPQSTDPEKLIVDNRKSVVVVKPNELLQQPMEIDQGDDLENLTLDDFPDIKTLPRGLSASLKTPSQNSVLQRTPWKPGFLSAGKKIQIPVNSMVADTIESTNTSTQPQGYTVLVTNLHEFVTQEDIVELFSDVGPVASAQLLQPGTAIVVYFTKAEAAQACDSYHNRLLDGQPMQCSLLPPNVSTGRSSLSSRLGGKLMPGSSTLPVSPPVSAFLPSATLQHSHSAVSAKNNQRSVQFTVKLP